jgi:hypothetical protein
MRKKSIHRISKVLSLKRDKIRNVIDEDKTRSAIKISLDVMNQTFYFYVKDA